MATGFSQETTQIAEMINQFNFPQAQTLLATVAKSLSIPLNLSDHETEHTTP